jgi:hypothetical protein
MHKGMADVKSCGGYKEKMADMNKYCRRKSGGHLETRRMLKTLLIKRNKADTNKHT